MLAEGETYAGPWLVGSYADSGLDAASARLHAWTRRHAPRARGARPVMVNTWEAAYFDHDLDRLGDLAGAAAAVGVERFVLDDGWFRGRRHDRAGLGDWTVDPAVWPQGLHPLIDEAKRLGMDFGLWVEPEMVNEDSDLVRGTPGLGAARPRGPAARVAAPAGARPPGARGLRARAGRAAARCWRSTTSRSSSGTTTAT